jgi:hypothetical protein
MMADEKKVNWKEEAEKIKLELDVWKKEAGDWQSAYNESTAQKYTDDKTLEQVYRLFWTATHRTPGMGPGTKSEMTKFVETVLKPRLTLPVCDQLDRELIDGK